VTSAVYDFASIAKLTKAFAETPPQNAVEPPKEPETPAYSYSSEDLQNVDYGMFAGCLPPTITLGTAVNELDFVGWPFASVAIGIDGNLVDLRTVYVTDGNDPGV
jgi:hypothetical protein